MKRFKIDITNTNETFHVIDGGEFEYCDPFEKLFEARLNANMMLKKSKLKQALPLFSDSEIDLLIYNKTVEENIQENQNLLDIVLPDGLLKIFNLTTKDEQINALKGISLSTKEMQSFILKAFLDYGFKYSFYRSDYHYNGLDRNRIPTFFYKDDNGKVTSTGDTDMTNGEIKQMIDHRKVTISKFFDNGERWHCFFHTYKSLGGKESSYKDGQPHLHYISYAFGLSRENVLRELKSEKYKLSAAPHIDYYSHRNPRE